MSLSEGRRGSPEKTEAFPWRRPPLPASSSREAATRAGEIDEPDGQHHGLVDVEPDCLNIHSIVEHPLKLADELRIVLASKPVLRSRPAPDR